MPNEKTLVVIISDVLSDIIQKGEIIDRYYNPGDFFSEVHLIFTNNDKPDLSTSQRMVGSAKLFIHNTFSDKLLFLLTLGWNKKLLDFFNFYSAKKIFKYKPDLIRCHGAYVNLALGAAIKKKLNIPLIVSLHINMDEDRKNSRNFIKKFVSRKREKIEKNYLSLANIILPVYSPIIPYLKRLKLTNYEICYNVINPKSITKKTNYALCSPVRIISVGRQFKEKNPINIIKAIEQIPNTTLTIVGDGPYHSLLYDYVKTHNLLDKVFFIKSMPNDLLCKTLNEYDLFAVHTEFFEISKSVLEPLLTGLPVIINFRKGEQVMELTSDICYKVENKVSAYKEAIESLISKEELRIKLGECAIQVSSKKWSPTITEKKFVDIYKKQLSQS